MFSLFPIACLSPMTFVLSSSFFSNIPFLKPPPQETPDKSLSPQEIYDGLLRSAHQIFFENIPNVFEVDMEGLYTEAISLLSTSELDDSDFEDKFLKQISEYMTYYPVYYAQHQGRMKDSPSDSFQATLLNYVKEHKRRNGFTDDVALLHLVNSNFPDKKQEVQKYYHETQMFKVYKEFVDIYVSEPHFAENIETTRTYLTCFTEWYREKVVLYLKSINQTASDQGIQDKANMLRIDHAAHSYFESQWKLKIQQNQEREKREAHHLALEKKYGPNWEKSMPSFSESKGKKMKKMKETKDNSVFAILRDSFMSIVSSSNSSLKAPIPATGNNSSNITIPATGSNSSNITSTQNSASTIAINFSWNTFMNHIHKIEHDDFNTGAQAPNIVIVTILFDDSIHLVEMNDQENIMDLYLKLKKSYGIDGPFLLNSCGKVSSLNQKLANESLFELVRQNDFEADAVKRVANYLTGHDTLHYSTLEF